MIATLGWIADPCKPFDVAAADQARLRQGQLTKPPGSLGRLEDMAIRLAGLQGTPTPTVDPVQVLIFAADHGVVAEGVSAYPQSVTTQMIRNIAGGGAAISVLSRRIGARLEVVDLGTVTDPGPLPGVRCERIGPGTGNIARGPAMSGAQLATALNAGRVALGRAAAGHVRLLVGGEMGIGNTTAASALACALLDASPSELVGPGTGLDPSGVAHKTGVVALALSRHLGQGRDWLELFARLGGFEIAALAGAFVAAAQCGVPVLVDGFIVTVAAAAAVRLNPGVREWLLFSHCSEEPGHRRLLDALDAKPLIDLGMRLGEGSGAAVTVPLLQLACAMHRDMATFHEAGVSSSV